MADALYAPGRGYYVREGRTVGRSGDFSTSATLHPAFGACILRWAARRCPKGRMELVELGAGGGDLAAAILRAAGWWGRRRIDYRIVEISPSLAARQRTRLARRHVQWFRDVEEAVEGFERPLLFSNEFVDAFPCRQFERRDGIWWERHVLAPGRVTRVPADEEVGALASSALECERWPGGRVPDGQVVEVHASYARWLGHAAAAVPAGAHLLTIDYGDTMPGLYERRPRGTLRGYFQHQVLEGHDVFKHPGKIDLTSDVNFTDLREWGEAVAWRTRGYEIQRDFLMRHLPPRYWRSSHPALSFLLDPDGAGGAFKVLAQEKG